MRAARIAPILVCVTRPHSLSVLAQLWFAPDESVPIHYLFIGAS